MKKLMVLFVLMVCLFFIAKASAIISCFPAQTNINYTFGDSINQQISCTNTGNQIVDFSLSGNSFDVSPKFLQPNSTNTIIITFSSTASIGNHLGGLIFNDNSQPYPISFIVLAQENQNPPSSIIIFPTAKVINVLQGQTKSQNIQLIVPSSYPTSITIQNILTNPDTDVVKFGDLDLGVVQPGTTVNIPIKIDSTDAQTGTYSTNILILATNTTGQIILPSTKLDINIQGAINPITNATFTTKPTCSLSAAIMNLNQTYSFTCTNAVNNIEIHPEYNDFFEGVSAEQTSTSYVYNFKPIKFGNTFFKTTFTYRGAPIFSAFSQEIKISSTSSVAPGTSLGLLFTPSLSRIGHNERVIIQVIDNKSGSLVNNPEIYINSEFLPLNDTVKSFTYRFEIAKEYIIRARSTGYDDLVSTVKITTLPLKLILTPETGDTSTVFTVNISESNSSLFLDGNIVTNPYIGTLAEGIHEFTAVKEGFQTEKKNLSVAIALTVKIVGEFKKGEKAFFSTNKNTTWAVYYQKDSAAEKETIITGTNTSIEFLPTKNGLYNIKAEGKVLGTYELKKRDTLKIFGIAWWWYIFFIVIIGMIFFYRKNNKGAHGMPSPAYTPTIKR